MLPEFGMDSLVLSLKSTGIDAAKYLNSLIRMRKKDAFAGIYNLDTLMKVEGQMEWYVPLITNAGWTNKEQYDFAAAEYEALFKGLKAGTIAFDAEHDGGNGDAAFAGRDAEM
jgi:hypothetical protein